MAYEHYRPIVESKGVMLDRSMEGLFDKIEQGLARPDALVPFQRRFLGEMLADSLDGKSGRRVAEALVHLALKGMK